MRSKFQMFLTVTYVSYMNRGIAMILISDHILHSLLAWTILTFFRDTPILFCTFMFANVLIWFVTQYKSYIAVREKVLEELYKRQDNGDEPE